MKFPLFGVYLQLCAWLLTDCSVVQPFSSVSPRGYRPWLVDLGKAHRLSTHGECALELYALERQLIQLDDEPLRRVRGRFVSDHCETLPGPTFQLRDYRFYESGRFLLRKYQYDDAECRRPSMAFVSRGRLRHISRSWSVPGGNEASAELQQVHIITYTKAAAKALTLSLRKSCRPDTKNKFHWPWLDSYQQLLIYKTAPLDPDSYTGIRDDIDCLEAVNYTSSELQLVKLDEEIQHSGFNPSKRLHLGLPIWDARQGAQRRPTHFQPPLLHRQQHPDCRICQTVAEGNQLSPPLPRRGDQQQFEKNPGSLLSGDWLSTGCESHINGIYVQRQLSFSAATVDNTQAIRTGTWSIKQRHFDDPRCKQPSYTLTSSGRYETNTGATSFADVLPPNTFTAVTLTAVRVALIAESRRFARNLSHLRNCGAVGRRRWRRNQRVDLTNNGGCSPMGLRVPSKINDVVRVATVPAAKRKRGGGSAVKQQQRLLLYTGDLSTVYYSGNAFPTVFRAPMAKCNDISVVVSLYNGRYGAKTSHGLRRTKTIGDLWVVAGYSRCVNNFVLLIFGSLCEHFVVNLL